MTSSQKVTVNYWSGYCTNLVNITCLVARSRKVEAGGYLGGGSFRGDNQLPEKGLMEIERHCNWCKETMDCSSRQSSQKLYCGHRCRNASYENRKKLETGNKVLPRYCEHGGIRYPATSNKWVRLSTCPWHPVMMGIRSLEWLADKRGVK